MRGGWRWKRWNRAAAWRRPPAQIGFLVILVLMLVMSSALVAGVIYFREYRQAFCIGALTSHALGSVGFLFGRMMPFGYIAGDEIEFKIFTAIFLLVIFICGLTAILVRFIALRASPSPKSSRIPPPL